MTTLNPHRLVIAWITDALLAHPAPVAIALRQRAKFEGWLKFALAAIAESHGAEDVVVEAQTSASGDTRARSDVSFHLDGTRFDVELKTPNTNWRMPGVVELTRPITKNFSSIVEDARKPRSGEGRLLIAFVIFPVPVGDQRWQQYLERIGQELKTELPVSEHAHQFSVPISDSTSADVVVCCFQA